MRRLIRKSIRFMQKSIVHRILISLMFSVVLVFSGLAISFFVSEVGDSVQVAQAKNNTHAEQKKVQSRRKENNKLIRTEKRKSIQKIKIIDWTKPSENKPYPEIKTAQDLILDVNLDKQRVYVKNQGNKVIYTMFASSGMKGTTPKGNFTIEAERGTNFYNAEEKMGANFYTSFHQHGVYLFHTVPTDINGEYIKNEADLLGQRPSSHGCIRLSIPDAKWIFEKIPFGTKVYIH